MKSTSRMTPKEFAAWIAAEPIQQGSVEGIEKIATYDDGRLVAIFECGSKKEAGRACIELNTQSWPESMDRYVDDLLEKEFKGEHFEYSLRTEIVDAVVGAEIVSKVDGSKLVIKRKPTKDFKKIVNEVLGGKDERTARLKEAREKEFHKYLRSTRSRGHELGITSLDRYQIPLHKGVARKRGKKKARR